MQRLTVRARIIIVLFGTVLNTRASGALVPSYSFTTINVPGATNTQANGINNRGEIVGSFTDATGTHGFIYSAGTFTTINVPGATGGTEAYGINDNGHVVGR